MEHPIFSVAGNRETAIQWIMSESGIGDDLEYIEYRFSLPFGYLQNV